MQGYSTLDGSGKGKTLTIALIAFLAIILLFVIIGIATPYATLTIAGLGLTVESKIFASTEGACSSAVSHVDAARAFAIIAILLLIAAIVLTVIKLIGKRVGPPIIPTVVIAAVFFCILVTWAVEATLMTAEFCGIPSAESMGAKYGAGFGLLVTAWIFSGVAIVVSFLSNRDSGVSTM